MAKITINALDFTICHPSLKMSLIPMTIYAHHLFNRKRNGRYPDTIATAGECPAAPVQTL